jgi:hypothetical protein
MGCGLPDGSEQDGVDTVQSAINGGWTTYGTTAQITINSSAVMTVSNPGGLSVSTLFLSLDGVSFGI